MNIHKRNKKRCITALSLCILVCFLALVVISLRLIASDKNYSGIEGYRYFTTLANMLVGACAFLCIPFEIDGLRYHNYHLPRWLINFLYVGVCCTTTTFLMAVTTIAPYLGLYKAFIKGNTFFAHFLEPAVAIVLFIFINDDHEIKKPALFFAMLPLMIYGIVYMLMVFKFNIWVDHYYVKGVLPLWASIILVFGSHFLIAYLLAKAHNRQHQKEKILERNYYLNGPEVSFETIEEAIANLAKNKREVNKKTNIEIPLRIILMMNEKYHSKLDEATLCQLYLKAYFKQEM